MATAHSIVSLIASATEIVCALGLRDRLIGVSHECDFPVDVKNLPTLSNPKLDPKKPGHEIDRRVRELVRDGLSVYEIDVERLEALAPDLIVTQDHCEVCAVSLADVEKATSCITLKTTRICSLHPNSLEDVSRDFQKVADAAGVAQRGRDLVVEFKQRLRNIEQQVAALPSRSRVACLEWLSPPMLAAGWMAELVEIAGGVPVVVDGSKSFSTVSWDDVRRLDPDVVVIMPCGYPIEQTLDELNDEALQAELKSLRAFTERRLYVVDGNAYFNRPGPRLADSAEILAGLIWPEIFRALRTVHAAAFTDWTALSSRS